MSREKQFLIGTVLVILAVIGAGLWGRRADDAKLIKQADRVNQEQRQTSQMNNANLKIEDLTVGTGAVATNGAKITVNYRGTLTNSTEFDSSYKRNQPFSFNLGAGEVIAGWDQGFVGMKVGGKRKLIIPPELGYGDRPAGSIPPNSTLIFEVELLKVE